MNPEEFEQALMRDLASVSRRDPTAAWKADILARASAPAKGKVITFPRLVLFAWAACWTAALVLHFMTPDTSAANRGALTSVRSAASADTEWQALETRRKEMSALLASNDSNFPTHP